MPAYEADLATFTGLNTQVLGISVDHVPCLDAWAEHLGGITFPLISDFWPHGAVAQRYGVLRDDGKSERAIFIIDREGVIRYIDIHDIDQQPKNEELFAVLREIYPEAAAKNPRPASEPIPELPSDGIIMYCTNWCPACRRARAWLEARHLPYREIDITKNRGAAAQVRAWANGNETTPTFYIDGKVIVDFNLPKLEEILNSRLKSAT